MDERYGRFEVESWVEFRDQRIGRNGPRLTCASGVMLKGSKPFFVSKILFFGLRGRERGAIRGFETWEGSGGLDETGIEGSR